MGKVERPSNIHRRKWLEYFVRSTEDPNARAPQSAQVADGGSRRRQNLGIVVGFSHEDHEMVRQEQP